MDISLAMAHPQITYLQSTIFLNDCFIPSFLECNYFGYLTLIIEHNRSFKIPLIEKKENHK